jgi:hypothetical protein
METALGKCLRRMLAYVHNTRPLVRALGLPFGSVHMLRDVAPLDYRDEQSKLASRYAPDVLLRQYRTLSIRGVAAALPPNEANDYMTGLSRSPLETHFGRPWDSRSGGCTSRDYQISSPTQCLHVRSETRLGLPTRLTR